MSDPIAVLPLDITGQARSNLIDGEEHAPAAGASRLILPRYGAFFATTLVVVNALTQAPVPKTAYKVADVWAKATEESSQTVVTAIVLNATAPASVAITYQAYGGPGSRNAQVLLDWFHTKLSGQSDTLDFADLKDFPKKVEPAEHVHLASHIYGMEYVVDAINRVVEAVKVGGQDSRTHARALIASRVKQLHDRTMTTVQGVVQNAFYKWRDEINLFYLGCDQLLNYPMLSMDEAAAAVAGSFVVENNEDDRYVNLSGLGTFCKGLADRLLQKSAGLGVEYSIAADPHRGSLLVAKVGSTFTLPPMTKAVQMSERYREVYPKDYPDDVPMIVQKVGAHPLDRAGLFMAYHPKAGSSWIGVLVDSRFTTRIEWFRCYFANEQLDLDKMLQDHVDSIGAVHRETKEDVGLSELENLPIVTVDDILSETPADKLHTLATLRYAMLAWMEGVKLPLGSNGQVNMDDNPMRLPKVIMGTCENKDAGNIEFVKSFCVGSNLLARWTNGKGGFEDKMMEVNSDECKFRKIPDRGVSLGRSCDPTSKNMMERIADGNGGSDMVIVVVNDPTCGYVVPEPRGKKLQEFCSGVNMMARYANGNGGYEDVPILINTVKCNGTNFESPGTSGGTGGGASGNAKILLASTHKRIWSGTNEVMSIYYTGLQPNTQYTSSLYAQSPAMYNGVATEMMQISFRTGATGSFTKELKLLDQGVAPRGEYDNWVVMLSENLESNHIKRTFLAGDAPSGNTDPNSDTGGTRPDGGNVGTGDTDTKPEQTSKPIDIDGNPYGEGAWPPRPVFRPLLELATNRPIIYPGDNETQTAKLSGFMAGESYTLRYYFTSTAYDNGKRTQSFVVNFVANELGTFEHTLHLYDDGSLPRGVYVCTVEVDNYTSPSITRTFAATVDGGVKPVQSPSIVYTCSHSTIVQGTVYTETVVLSGLEPNTKFTVSIRSGYFDGAILGGERASFVALTDNNGNYRWERTTTDDGVTVKRATYQTAASIFENKLISGYSWITYGVGSEQGTTGTQLPKIDYASTLQRINKGDTETQTVTLSNAKANTEYEVEWWIKSPALNGGQDFRSTTTKINTNAQGAGTSVLTTTDDGTTVPRGDYQCWVAVKALSIRSSTIVRSFLVNNTTPAPTTTPTLKDAVLSFSTSHPTISQGTVETMTARLQKFIPNTFYSIDLWIRSPALGNGGQSVKTGTLTCTTDTNGNGTATLTITDNGVTPRGEYQSWAVCQSVTSNTIVRTFVGATTVYNPQVTYSTNLTTIGAGSTETQLVQLTGAQPNTAYTLEFWTQSPALSNNIPFRGTYRTVVTDNSGNANAVLQTYDDGAVVPRGTYSSWGRVAELDLKSPTVTRVFIGTPPPTEPPFYPVVSYWTDRSTLYQGVAEMHSISIGGMRANTTYNVQIWVQSPALWGGVASHMKTVQITTNSTGNGGTYWGQFDDGVTPRGSYANWAVIAETGTTSPTFTRVFV